ncbi:MAG: dihydropteroate synthase [Gammaproteobacteria bacterium]|nr:dihydropteroate synthase [Gammaproteobacteria bacterium]
MISGLQCADRVLDLGRPQVMGILNVTPDSFSDGGRFNGLDAALAQAERMLEAGAAIIDVGGESTRPGAADVSLDEELRRVIPVIEAIRKRFDSLVSIDTSKAEVMRQAVRAGAGLINDVRALREPGAVEAAADSDAAICLMHMQGAPRTMQTAPSYRDVVTEVGDFLKLRVAQCEAAGIARNRLMLDPGFGFGKTLDHNLTLLEQLSRLTQIGLPLLVGVSRKRMIGSLLGERPVEARVHGSVAAAVIAAMHGARVLRVHDVAETVDALAIVAGLEANRKQ